MPYLPMVKAIAPNAPIGAAYIRMWTIRKTIAVSVLSSVLQPCAPLSPISASAMPNRIATSSTCRICPSVKALTRVSGMMFIRKPVTLCSCAWLT